MGGVSEVCPIATGKPPRPAREVMMAAYAANRAPTSTLTGRWTSVCHSASLTGTATRSRRPFRGLKEIRGIIQPEPARERLPAQKHYEPPKKVGTVGGVK